MTVEQIHYRYAHDETGVQRRFYELRYDADKRKLSGTAMRYGDEAELPWGGGKERFDPGAFAPIEDVILNVQHDRTRPIARTSGGTLEIRDTGASMDIEAQLPETVDASDALENVRAGILRGFSVEFRPEKTRLDGDTIVVEKAVLRGIGLVDRPAYKKSLVVMKRGQDMDPKEIQELVERAVKESLSKRSDTDASVDSGALATAVAGVLSDSLKDIPTAESVRASIDEALKQRDEAEEARAKAEEERAKAEKKAKDDEEMMKKNADKRAEILLMTKPLLPENTETRGKTNHELLVLAVGDEVSDAENRSEDYLTAKVEEIAKRRDDAAGGPPPASGPVVQQNTGAGVSMAAMAELRHNRAAA